MKVKYLIFLSIIGLAAFYIYQDESLQMKLMGKVHEIAPELNQSTLYKWQNSKCEWQITDRPPAKGITFTTINSQDQINVMPSPSTKKKE